MTISIQKKKPKSSCLVDSFFFFIMFTVYINREKMENWIPRILKLVDTLINLKKIHFWSISVIHFHHDPKLNKEVVWLSIFLKISTLHFITINNILCFIYNVKIINWLCIIFFKYSMYIDIICIIHFSLVNKQIKKSYAF